MTRLAIGSLALLAILGGCQQAPQRSAANSAAAAACRSEVDRVYAAQNRADLSRRDERDTPFAGSYLSGITTRQLGAQYSRGNQMATCLAQSGVPARGDAGTGSTFSPSTPATAP